MSVKTQKFLNQAFALHRSGRFKEAADLYRQVIKRDPSNHHALHSLGIVEASAGNLDEAVRLMSRSLAFQPANVDFIENYATVLCQAGNFPEAADAAEKGLKVHPSPKLLYISATSLSKTGRHDRALARFAALLAREPRHIAALNDRAISLAELERYDEALASIDTAIQAMPNFAEAYLNRGNIYRRMNRFQEAIAAFEKAVQFNNNLAAAWLGLGNTLRDMRLFDKALQAYDRAIAIDGKLAEAWFGRASAARDLKNFEVAIAAYEKAIARDPDIPALEGLQIYAKLGACDWRNIEKEIEHLLGGVRAGKPVSDPFALLALPSTGQDQLACAKTWSALKFPSRDPLWKGEAYSHDRIRLAYLSADFTKHATANLIAGLFEHHDRSRFEITAIALNEDDGSEISKRMRGAFEHWLDADQMLESQITDYIRKSEIDILVDLKGYTRGARTSILARRPAPVQVNYLGYPGSMGADFIDYIIADEVVAPAEHAVAFSEKIIRLPHTYQINDRLRAISDLVPTRAEAHLPEAGFVFCCFNNNYKITPQVFSSWMRILDRIEGSVLWLLEDNATASANLRREATARGVDPARLIFAERTGLPDHLARHALADLFLDTSPYNAHTTASDALWAGLPVLTMIGETFAGRVCASLLGAAGLPELVTPSSKDYEETAISLASSPERLGSLRKRLRALRHSCPLFDTHQLTRDIESAFVSMLR
jgi:predicted O-linked N-acetylglucosamine transferase (SPINDLY family)